MHQPTHYKAERHRRRTHPVGTRNCQLDPCAGSCRTSARLPGRGSGFTPPQHNAKVGFYPSPHCTTDVFVLIWPVTRARLGFYPSPHNARVGFYPSPHCTPDVPIPAQGITCGAPATYHQAPKSREARTHNPTRRQEAAHPAQGPLPRSIRLTIAPPRGCVTIEAGYACYGSPPR